MSRFDALESTQLERAERSALVSLPVTPVAHSLRLLALMRALAVPFQGFLLWYAVDRLGLEFAAGTVALLIGIQAVVASLTWMRLVWMPVPVTAREVFAQVHVDIVLFAAALYHCGGTTNPYAPLLVLPMVAVGSLPRPWMLATAVSTVGAYVFLRHYHVPITHPLGLAEVFRIHASGDQISYTLTTATLAYFVNKSMTVLRRHERMMADVQERQMRNDSIVAIGAFAAGCAHELSSPLATMSVVVKELQGQEHSRERISEDLRILEDQIRISKDIVTQFTGAAGRRRAESAGALQLDRFLQGIVDRARVLHPGATIAADIGSPVPAPRIVAEETLRQALTNVLDNAVQASPCDVRFAASWTADELVITVSDRGPGFPPEALSKLGKTIYTTKGPGHGSGLGLMLTHVTLGRLGGTLELGNRPEGGACATVRLPLQTISF